MPLPRRLAFIAGFALTGAISVAMASSGHLTSESSTTPPTSSAATAPDRVAQLVTRHGCWTGQAPADMQGQLPGHVVVTPAGATEPIRGGSLWVGRALEHAFDGKHPGLTVHAFCH